MNKPNKPDLDCVKMKDEAQKKLWAEMKGMTLDEQIAYINGIAEKYMKHRLRQKKQPVSKE